MTTLLSNLIQSLLLVLFSATPLLVQGTHNHQVQQGATIWSWHLCGPASQVPKQQEEDGVLLSTVGAVADNCMPAKVPGTILSNLLENGKFNVSQDEIYQETNLDSIPDIYTTGPAPWTYYYVANVSFSPDDPKKNHILLELRSINYQAEIWCNGERVRGASDESIRGMFQRFQFPLNALGHYYLAILVHPPPHPGQPNGGQGGSTHALAQDGPVSQFTAGWDWIQATPDRNTGLWDIVQIKQTGKFQLRDPFVQISNINVANRQADLEFQVQLDCREAPCAQELQGSVVVMQLEYHVVGQAMIQRRHVRLEDRSSDSGLVFTTTACFPTEKLQNAQLWYPHTHGNPALYQATIKVGIMPEHFMIPKKGDSLIDMNWDDQVSLLFGIRKVEFDVNPKLNGLQATINDQQVFLQGGNWIATDQLMRFSGDIQRYQSEVGLHKAMGFNMIRVWGGGITERPEFFEACDQLGILVLSDLWMSGDNNGRWAGSYSWPNDHSLYLNAIRDTFLLLRNHPSLVMYSVGNELYPTDKNPPPDILSGIKQALQEIDPDTFLVASTMTNWTDFDPKDSLCPKDGPYGVMEEAFYYERNPGLYDWKNHEHYRLLDVPIAFQPEIGSASFPTLASLRRFMNSTSLQAIPGYLDSNVHPTWEYHKFLGFTSHRKPFAKNPKDDLKVDMIYQYGAPANISEYTIRAQLVQFTQFRSLFESFRLKMFEWYTAVLFWKSQSPWPSLRGGLYDWYLGMTGGYYGVRAALLSGIQSASVVEDTNHWWAHAQMNLMDHSIAVITSPSKSSREEKERTVRVQVDAYHLAGCQSGQHLLSRTMYASVKHNAVFPIPNSTIPFVGNDITLYRITAAGNDDDDIQFQTVSEYWLSNWTPSSNGGEIPVQDLSSLGQWRDDTSRHVVLDISAIYCGYCLDGMCHSSSICQAAGCTHSEIAVRLRNPHHELRSNCEHDTIAFAVWTELHSMQEMDVGKDTRILPTLYSNGLFSILRNETRYVCMDPSLGQNGNWEISNLQVHVSGWNVQQAIVPVEETSKASKIDK